MISSVKGSIKAASICAAVILLLAAGLFTKLFDTQRFQLIGEIEEQRKLAFTVPSGRGFLVLIAHRIGEVQFGEESECHIKVENMTRKNSRDLRIYGGNLLVCNWLEHKGYSGYVVTTTTNGGQVHLGSDFSSRDEVSLEFSVMPSSTLQGTTAWLTFLDDASLYELLNRPREESNASKGR